MNEQVAVLRQTRAWLKKSVLRSAIQLYVQHLIGRGYARSTVRVYACCVGHFAYWLRNQRIRLDQIDETVIRRFLYEHLPSCKCPGPVRRTRYELRAALNQLLIIKQQPLGRRRSEASRHGVPAPDVDLDSGTLTIRRTKFQKSRLVPTHPSTAQILRDYASARKQTANVSDRFFVSMRGVGLKDRTVHGVFQRLRAQLGWTARGGHPHPRIHDLRHSFICHRIKRWYRQGINVDHAIVALSTYVGHVKVTDTYWYLTGIPDLMAIVARKFERFAQGQHV